MTDVVEVSLFDKLYQDLQECLSNVNDRLTAQRDSKYVTRYTEKNFLTYKCMSNYYNWRSHNSDVVTKACSTANSQCHILKDSFTKTDDAIQNQLINSFKLASSEEDAAFSGLISRVEAGTILIQATCPFHKNITLPEHRTQKEHP